MTAGPGSARPTSVVLPGIEADPLFADAVDEAIAGDASTMPGVLDRPVGRDPHDFSSLYVRHRASFVAHARRYLSDQRDIDEVVQESVLRLFLALPELETELQALSYCRRTVTNLCIDRFRAQARRPRLVGYEQATDADLWDDGNIDDPIYAAEDAAVVRQALALLSPTHREALIKREVEEKSLAQIADEMGIPETAVKHTLHRARRSLRRALAELWAESGQGVKSALVLIMAVLLALPFVTRNGGSGVSREAAIGVTPTSAPASPTAVALPEPTTNNAPLPAGPSTPAGSAQWPSVPQLSLPDVPVPPVVTKPVEPTPQPTHTDGPTTPDPGQTPPPNPADEPALSVRGAYTLVAAPTVTQQVFAQSGLGGTQVSALRAETTDGSLVLSQSFTKFDDGSMDISVAPSLPIGGQSLPAPLRRLDYNAQVATDGSYQITVSADVGVPSCDLPLTIDPTAVVGAQVSIDLRLSSDLASVIAESVVVTSTQLAGSADAAVACGGPPASPPSTDGAPQEVLPDSSQGLAAKVEEQVTATF
ncbi:MAG: polymerase subunit sigma-24 [Frankiales bacterium]|nr:polymerase subunit sigma-24 [Frankiales bacterium]